VSLPDKGDASPLTRADLASHRLLERRLIELTPRGNVPVVSEETESAAAADAELTAAAGYGAAHDSRRGSVDGGSRPADDSWRASVDGGFRPADDSWQERGAPFVNPDTIVFPGVDAGGDPIEDEPETGSDTALRRLSLAPAVWLVDPLDGTKEFIGRNGEFTVNVALCVFETIAGPGRGARWLGQGWDDVGRPLSGSAEAGSGGRGLGGLDAGACRPVAGAVHAPALGATWVAVPGGKAWRLDAPASDRPSGLRPLVGLGLNHSAGRAAAVQAEVESSRIAAAAAEAARQAAVERGDEPVAVAEETAAAFTAAAPDLSSRPLRVVASASHGGGGKGREGIDGLSGPSLEFVQMMTDHAAAEDAPTMATMERDEFAAEANAGDANAADSNTAASRAHRPPPVLERRGSSLKLVALADGTADVYPRLGSTTYPWCSAAGIAIVRSTGGEVWSAGGGGRGFSDGGTNGVDGTDGLTDGGSDSALPAGDLEMDDWRGALRRAAPLALDGTGRRNVGWFVAASAGSRNEVMAAAWARAEGNDGEDEDTTTKP